MLNRRFLQALRPTLNINAARLKTLCLMIDGIIRHRTVNLTILATTHDGKPCLNESRYRRFQDFFLNGSLGLLEVSRSILKRIPRPKGGYLLAMDRTNWKFGRKDINFLVIAIIVGKVSIPVAWKVLPAKTGRGNSNAADRIELMDRLLEVLPAHDIKALTMDREFIGRKWLAWLEARDVGYVVRIKKNAWVGDSTAQERASRRGPNPGGRLDVFGTGHFFGSKRMDRGGRQSHLMVVSNRFAGKEALALYRMRWGIERLFGHMKKKGFDLEATHMTAGFKLEKLFAIVVFAFLFCFGWGCHLRTKEEGSNAARKRKSLFRLGLEDLIRSINPPPSRADQCSTLDEFFKWLNSANYRSIFLV